MGGRSTRSSSRPSRAERREQLLDDATEALRTLGAGASMEQLAAAGGVTKPILYRHFGDRDGLAAALGERFVGDLLERLTSALRSPTPESLLHDTIDAYLTLLEEQPELYTFLTSPTSGRGGLADPAAVLELIARQVAVAVGDNLRAQGIDAGAAEPYAFGIVGMVHQAGDWWLRSQTMSRQALTTYLARLLWNGFAGLADADPATPGRPDLD